VRIAYHLQGGGPLVADEHVLVDPDGRCTVWRSSGGHRVGAFSWRIARDELSRLEEQADATGPVSHAGADVLDAPTGVVMVDGAPVAADGSLLAGLDRLLTEAPAHPQAAVELGVDVGSGRAWIVRIGDGPLQAVFDQWQAFAEVQGPGGAARTTTGLAAPAPGGLVALDPGWRFDFALPSSLGPGPTEALVVQASFLLVHRGVPHTVTARRRQTSSG
jgi:hypothetical protein